MHHRPVLLLLATVLVFGTVAGCGSEASSSGSREPTSAPTSTTATTAATAATAASAADPGPGAAVSCVSDYSADTLRERSFAFDGTVIERRDERDPKGPTEEDGGDVVTTRALFEVHEWFAGGTDQTALVWMMRDVAVGDRLLITGEPRWGGEPLADAIAWECGFTAVQSDALAAEWRAALSP